MIAVQTRDLSLWFDQLQVLQGFDLVVQENEIVAFLGPSGCGKSTLLRVIGGIIPTMIPARLEGQIAVFGAKPGELQASIDMISQEGGLLPWRTAIENVCLGPEVLHQKTNLSPQQLLERMGLNGFAQQYPRQLSGGMRQRVMLAATLVTNPKLLLMDEPLASLDSLTREAMWQLIEELKLQELIKTAILVTHSIEEAVILADRVLLMSSCPCQIIENVPVKVGRPRTKDNGVLDQDCLELANYIRARIRGVANEKE